MAIAETIVARADPYTIVIIPDVRITYKTGGVPLSVGQLARVEYAEVIPGGIRISPALSFTVSMGPLMFYVTSGSGNVVTVRAFDVLSALGGAPGAEAGSGFLSCTPLTLKAYGR